MEPTVELKDLTKRYRSTVAVRSLSLRVEPGAILGLVGPNGAGKTTLLNMMAGLLEPSEGSVRLFGRTYAEAGNDIRALTGVMRDDPGLYESLTGSEHLSFTGSAYGLDPAEVAAVPRGAGVHGPGGGGRRDRRYLLGGHEEEAGPGLHPPAPAADGPARRALRHPRPGSRPPGGGAAPPAVLRRRHRGPQLPRPRPRRPALLRAGLHQQGRADPAGPARRAARPGGRGEGAPGVSRSCTWISSPRKGSGGGSRGCEAARLALAAKAARGALPLPLSLDLPQALPPARGGGLRLHGPGGGPHRAPAAGDDLPRGRGLRRGLPAHAPHRLRRGARRLRPGHAPEPVAELPAHRLRPARVLRHGDHPHQAPAGPVYRLVPESQPRLSGDPGQRRRQTAGGPDGRDLDPGDELGLRARRRGCGDAGPEPRAGGDPAGPRAGPRRGQRAPGPEGPRPQRRGPGAQGADPGGAHRIPGEHHRRQGLRRRAQAGKADRQQAAPGARRGPGPRSSGPAAVRNPGSGPRRRLSRPAVGGRAQGDGRPAVARTAPGPQLPPRPRARRRRCSCPVST